MTDSCDKSPELQIMGLRAPATKLVKEPAKVFRGRFCVPASLDTVT